MVRRCAWGRCNADCRYLERLEGGFFVNFPKPKTNLDKCLRWIKACGRPHHQLNVGKIDKNKLVCSKHFIGGNGPSDIYPDPLPADGSRPKKCRQPPKKRRLVTPLQEVTGLENIEENSQPDSDSKPSIACQTEEQWISPLDVLALTAEKITYERKILDLEATVARKEEEILALKKEVTAMKANTPSLIGEAEQSQPFSIRQLCRREKRLKGLFVYYTGITYVRFLALLSFLVPEPRTASNSLYSRTDLRSFRDEDGLLLLLCHLRHDFGLKDLAVRFEISLQSAGAVFNAWLELFYFKYGQLSLWPNRDTIIAEMPDAFKEEFPTTLIVIDGTEFKTQTPSGLSLQSQLYSDYKSNTTLKGLIGCDPRGTIIFASELFTGSISDGNICVESGFYDLLKTLKSQKYIIDGDCIMADKGFMITDELKKIGLSLNIPPCARSGSQMSVHETMLTQKIARHRVHIERVIRKVKTYKMLSNRIPTSLFKQVNKIWTVCCFLTHFQDTFIKG